VRRMFVLGRARTLEEDYLHHRMTEVREYGA
jgi:hypothetical protein